MAYPEITCKACGQKIATEVTKPILREGVTTAWHSKDGWIAVTIKHGKFRYAGGVNEADARYRLDKLLLRPPE